MKSWSPRPSARPISCRGIESVREPQSIWVLTNKLSIIMSVAVRMRDSLACWKRINPAFNINQRINPAILDTLSSLINHSYDPSAAIANDTHAETTR